MLTNEKQFMIDKIHSLLYECDMKTLGSIYGAVWNIVERSDQNGLLEIYRKNAFQRKSGRAETDL